MAGKHGKPKPYNGGAQHKGGRPPPPEDTVPCATLLYWYLCFYVSYPLGYKGRFFNVVVCFRRPID